MYTLDLGYTTIEAFAIETVLLSVMKPTNGIVNAIALLLAANTLTVAVLPLLLVIVTYVPTG